MGSSDRGQEEESGYQGRCCCISAFEFESIREASWHMCLLSANHCSNQITTTIPAVNKKNGEIEINKLKFQVYGLPWSWPGWIGFQVDDGDHNGPLKEPAISSEYIFSWIKGARDVHGIFVDYIGCWNEQNCSKEHLQHLRKLLDSNGFEETKIVAKDGGWDICDSADVDEDYAKVRMGLGCL
jgi:hypothetical protein